MGATGKISCTKDADCYSNYWAEGASEALKSNVCCFANRISKIDAENAGYKLLVTSAGKVAASATASGPVTLNKVGYVG